MAVREKIVTCSLEAICGACADTMAVGFNVVEYGQPRRPLAAMDVVPCDAGDSTLAENEKQNRFHDGADLNAIYLREANLLCK